MYHWWCVHQDGHWHKFGLCVDLWRLEGNDWCRWHREDTVGLQQELKFPYFYYQASNQLFAPAIFIFFGYLLTLAIVLPQLLEIIHLLPERHIHQCEYIISKKLLNPLLKTKTFPFFLLFLVHQPTKKSKSMALSASGDGSIFFGASPCWCSLGGSFKYEPRKKGPWLVYIGDEILPSFIRIVINHDIRIPSLTEQDSMESKAVFVFRGSHVYC